MQHNRSGRSRGSGGQAADCKAYARARFKSCCFAGDNVDTNPVSFRLNIRIKKSHRTALARGALDLSPADQIARATRVTV